MKKINFRLTHFFMCIVPFVIFIPVILSNFFIVKADTDSRMWLLLFVIISAVICIELFLFIKPFFNTWNIKKPISITIHILSVLLSIVLLLFTIINIEELFPAFNNLSRPLIMQQFLFTLGVIALPVFYHLGCLAAISAEKNSFRIVWRQFILPAALPLLGVLFYWFLVTGDGIDSEGLLYIVIVLAVLYPISFFFFLIRALYIFIKSKKVFSLKIKIPFTLLFCLVFPLLGLYLNNKVASFALGNFSHPVFYIIPVLISGLLILSFSKNRYIRLITFALKSLTFIYSLYFFLIFLPFFPLSGLFLIVFGAGFLIMSPVILFFIHFKSLRADFIWLRNHYNKRILVSLIIISSLLIPGAVMSKMFSDKTVLTRALDFIDIPLHEYDNSVHDSVDSVTTKQLAGILAFHDKYIAGNRRMNFISNPGNIPCISALYKKIVLNNFSLGLETIKKLKRFYFGKKSNHVLPVINPSGESFETKVIDFSTEWDEDLKLNKSWVHFETRADTFRREFITHFNINDSVFVHDMYLDISGTREYGLLAERKVSEWVYNSLTSRSIDPAIINYVDSDTLSLKIFPVTQENNRTFGIEFYHFEKFTLDFDGNILSLADNNTNASENTDDAVFLTKGNTAIKKSPVYYFISDYSKNSSRKKSKNKSKNISLKIQEFLLRYGLPGDLSRSYIVAANNRYAAWTKNEYWYEGLESFPVEGGFMAVQLLQSLLLDYTLLNESDSFPVFVFLDGFDLDINEMKDLEPYFTIIPEGLFIYSYGKLQKYSTNEKQTTINLDVINYDKFLELSDQMEINYKEVKKSYDLVTLSRDWKTVFSNTEFISPDKETLEQLNKLNKVYYLTNKDRNSLWRRNINAAFNLHILTPFTSFISLEEEYQKNVLLQKQNEFLKGDHKLSTGNESIRMAGPVDAAAFALVIVFAVILVFRKRKEKNN